MRRQRGTLAMKAATDIIAKAANSKDPAAELERIADAQPKPKPGDGPIGESTVAHQLRYYAQLIRQGQDPNEIVKRNNEHLAKHGHDDQIVQVN